MPEPTETRSRRRGFSKTEAQRAAYTDSFGLGLVERCVMKEDFICYEKPGVRQLEVTLATALNRGHVYSAASAHRQLRLEMFHRKTPVARTLLLQNTSGPPLVRFITGMSSQSSSPPQVPIWFIS